MTGCQLVYRMLLLDVHALLIVHALTNAFLFPETILHDWWLALVASKFGKIIYTPICYVSYRQHSNNVVGAIGFKNMIAKRINKLYRDLSMDSWIGPGIYFTLLTEDMKVMDLSFQN